MTLHDSPSPTLTVLFTDVVGSTRLWETHPDGMSVAIGRHDSILRGLVESSQGRVVKSTGDGLMAVFPSASYAVKACIEAQEKLHAEPWGDIGPISVRMGMNAGELPVIADDYLGQAVNRAARIMAVAHGGQILVSAVVAGLAESGLPDGAGFRDLGEHRLRDLLRPEHIFQVTHPGLTRDFPPLSTLTQRPNNLPTQVSEFIGREAELTAVRDLFDQTDVRLITITGPGGIGKTRLGLQTAAERIEQFENGVFYVDLSPVRDAAEVFDAIIRTLDLPSLGDESSLEALRRALTAQRILLILDNFEQVIAAAEDLSALLRDCPGLRVMATSREALRVSGERLFPVPPLSLPEADGPTSIEKAGQSEAVQLFVERAKETKAGFTLTDENVAVVSEICARLDGLPLALELAAARLKLFSPIELRDRLRSRLELLGGGPRDAPARHQTLRKTIEWSYELLDDEERLMLAVLSVFLSARLEAVEEVAARQGQLRDLDVVELVSSLVDKSLLRSLDVDGMSRLSMLETIREFSMERLDDDEEFAAAVRVAHAEYYAELALSGHELGTAVDDLEPELNELTTAWRYWVAADDIDRLDQLYDALWDVHHVRGWYRAAVELTRDMLNVLHRTAPSTERARKEITLQTSLARGLMTITGYTGEVEKIYQRALALSEETGDLPFRFPALRSLASFYMLRGEFDRTAELGAEFLTLAQEQDDVSLQVEGHLLMGSSLAFLGDLSTGLEHLEAAIAGFDPNRQGVLPYRLGPNAGITAHTTAALFQWLLGHIEQAEERARSAIDLATRIDHPYTLAYALFHVGFLDLWRGELDQVRERARQVRELSDRYDYQIWEPLGLMLEGVSMVSSGSTDEGLAQIEQGLATYEGLKTPPIFWPLVLYLRASGFALAGRPTQGIELIDEAIAIHDRGFLFPEFSTLRGDMEIQASNTRKAETSFRDAISVAQSMGLRMSELRAATRLARLSGLSQSAPDAHDVLRSVYDTFEPGTNSRDLLEARSILDSS